MSIDKLFHNWITPKWGKNLLRDRFWGFVTLYGIWVLFVFVLANLIIATPADSLWPLFKQSALSVSLAWTVMICLSYIIKRPRPFKVRGEKALVKMWLETPSFPSGHTTLAFALASASCFSSLQPGIVVLAAFIMAAMVAFSRLYVGVHYLSDIFGGIAVGVGVVWLVFG